MAQDINYEEGRSRYLENEVFLRIDPRYPIPGSAISLVLSGEINSYPDGEEYGYYVDTESVANQNFTVRGIGFPLAEYEDTLRNCIEVWIPIEDSEGTIQEIRFKVKKRSSYRDWIYLWNYEEDNTATISGSWIVNGFGLAEDPYDVIGSTRPELDYTCSVLGPDRSIIFVYYEPTNFRFNGDYNAILNNAFTESKQDLFINSASVKLKKYISDYHKIQGIGGHSAGELVLDQGTDKEYIRTRNFIQAYSASSANYGEEGLQTLDLAFMSYRALSASVYVDRLDTNRSASISKVWDDIQEGNTDDPETAYFIPRCTMSLDTSSKRESESEEEYEERLERYGKLSTIHTTTVPTVGDLIFKVDQHTPVRYVEATLYAPFLNRVYRTDKFGAIVEEFPNSDFGEEEEL